jgi:hypothetical protein
MDKRNPILDLYREGDGEVQIGLYDGFSDNFAEAVEMLLRVVVSLVHLETKSRPRPRPAAPVSRLRARASNGGGR